MAPSSQAKALSVPLSHSCSQHCCRDSASRMRCGSGQVLSLPVAYQLSGSSVHEAQRPLRLRLDTAAESPGSFSITGRSGSSRLRTLSSAADMVSHRHISPRSGQRLFICQALPVHSCSLSSALRASSLVSPLASFATDCRSTEAIPCPCSR